MLESLKDLFLDTGFFYVDWRMILMWAVVAVLFYLAVYKEFEPLLLVPIAFGALLANLPTEGVVNKPAGEIISPAPAIVKQVFVQKGDNVFVPRAVKHLPRFVSDIVSPGASEQQAQAEVAQYFKFLDDVTTPQARKDVFKKAKGIPDLQAIVSPKNGNFETDAEAAKALRNFP